MTATHPIQLLGKMVKEKISKGNNVINITNVTTIAVAVCMLCANHRIPKNIVNPPTDIEVFLYRVIPTWSFRGKCFEEL